MKFLTTKYNKFIDFFVQIISYFYLKQFFLLNLMNVLKENIDFGVFQRLCKLQKWKMFQVFDSWFSNFSLFQVDLELCY